MTNTKMEERLVAAWDQEEGGRRKVDGAIKGQCE